MPVGGLLFMVTTYILIIMEVFLRKNRYGVLTLYLRTAGSNPFVLRVSVIDLRGRIHWGTVATLQVRPGQNL